VAVVAGRRTTVLIYPFDGASRTVLESLDFVEEGLIRNNQFVDSRFVDSVQYGLLREEWDSD
jgi:[ribosomal protein S5]-alanine N-acetyltransferase